MLWVFAIFFGVSIFYGFVLLQQIPQQPATTDAEQNTTQETPSVPTPNVPTDSDQAQPKDNTVPAYNNIGQEFSVGYWSYTCHGAYWTPVLGFDPYSMERANAEFVVIDVTARNDDASASTLPPFQLMDEEGRTYDESSAGTFSQGFFSVFEQLNPGVSKRGNVAFDVPPGRQYFLIASGGFESGKSARVMLPMSVPSGQQ